MLAILGRLISTREFSQDEANGRSQDKTMEEVGLPGCLAAPGPWGKAH